MGQRRQQKQKLRVSLFQDTHSERGVPTVVRKLLTLFSICLLTPVLSGCQKGDLEACADAKFEDYKGHPKRDDGSWNIFWDGGRFDEARARGVAVEICANLLTRD